MKKTSKAAMPHTNVYGQATRKINHMGNIISQGYSFNSNSTKSSSFQENVTCSLINSYFFSMKNKGLLHSDPIYIHTSTKVTIRVFYYVSSNAKEKGKYYNTTDISIKENSVSLSDALCSIFDKEVSLEFVQVHYPYLNSSIFAKYLAHNAPTNTFVHFQDSILTYPSRNASELPAYITGIKMEVSGRLVTEPIVPRVTKKSYALGSSSGGEVDYAKYTTKNFYGAFTIKV